MSNQLKLKLNMNVKIPNRPTEPTEEQWIEIAEDMIANTQFEGTDFEDDDLDDLVKWLKSNRREVDGYILAKSLEDEFPWVDPNESTVSDLGGLFFKIKNKVDERVRNWITEFNITPMFNVDQSVHDPKSGTIKKIDMDNGKYHVHREEDHPDRLRVYDWEKLEETDEDYNSKKRAVD